MLPVALLLEAVVQATATVAPLGVATTVPAAAAAAETVVPSAMWESAPWANRAWTAAEASDVAGNLLLLLPLLIQL